MISLVIFKSTSAKFTFPIIVSYSTLRNGLYLFYRKKSLLDSKKEKKMTCRQARLRENDDLPLWRASAIKKNPPFFHVRALVTCEIYAQ